MRSLLSIAADLADRGAIAIDNALLYKEMRDQDRRKNEFLAMLSHELRNPLAPITNAVHVLGTGDARKIEWARDVLDRQVKQLCRLVDDLLDVSRITHGKIELKFEAVDVAEVIGVAVETARPFVDARRHTLTVTPPVAAGARPGRLRPARAGSREPPQQRRQVHRRRRPDLAFARTAKATRSSFAFGIRAWAFPRRRSPPSSSRSGSSDRPPIGLRAAWGSASRSSSGWSTSMAARSRSAAKADSAGSEFVVRLPLLVDVSAGAPPELHVAEAAARRLPRRRRRILVADDNVDLATSMGLLLELMGNDVRVTHDGMAAVAADAEFRPDVVFLDIGMAKLNGLDACRHIRRKPWGKEPIIVALTGWGQAEDKNRSREAGFDHHLVKPIEPAVLQRFLAEIEPQTA